MSESNATVAIPRFPDAKFDRRFWSKVRVTDGCWEWVGSRTSVGYGQINVHGGPRTVHRLVYELCFGDPGELFVCHRCDNRACCRPDHLFLGTNAENMADMVRKGRSVKGRPQPEGAHKCGESHGRSRLTESQVVAIRRFYASGEATQDEIARRFGVSSSHVCGIISGRFWKHIPIDVPALPC